MHGGNASIADSKSCDLIRKFKEQKLKKWWLKIQIFENSQVRKFKFLKIQILAGMPLAAPTI